MFKKSKILPLLLILFISMEINFVFASAKYSTSATGNMIAQIANFEIEINEMNNQSQLELSEDNVFAEYGLSIKNKSDVGVVYSISMELPSELPGEVSVVLKDSANKVYMPTINQTHKIYTFEKVATANPNETNVQNFVLRFEINDIDSFEEDFSIDGIKLKAYVVQVN